MSYIKCKSIVTGQDVQYGLIDVSLKHKKRDLDYGCGNTNLYTAFWNTAPEASSTYSAIAVSGQNPPWNIEFGSDGMKTVTGRPTQGWDASGELVSQYGYVHRGTQPIISNQVIDVENLSHGINTVDLFETDNIKVQMEIAKLKPSEFLLPNMYSLASFKRDDGSYADKSLLDVIAAVVIKQIYKPENKVVGTYSYLDKIGSQCFPNKFTVTTEVFRIKDFDPRYTTWQQFDFDRSMWFDKGNTDQNTILKEGQNVSAKSDCVVMNFSVMATDWWSASRNYFDYTQLKVVDSNGSEISNNTLRSLIASGVRKYLLHCIDDTPNDFITFVQAINAYNAIPYSPYGDALTYMNSQVNGNGDYKITGYGVTNTTIFTVDNTVLSPLLIPHVDSNWNPTDATTNGTFIPLTDTVFEGDPEPPEEEETLEEADDEETTYDNGLPDDIDEGTEDNWNYETSDIISPTIVLGNIDKIQPSFSNYIFHRYYKQDYSGHDVDRGSAWEMLTDLVNVNLAEPFQTAKHWVTGHPTLDELVARVYIIPLNYNQLISWYIGNVVEYAAPYMGQMGTQNIVTGDMATGMSMFDHHNYYYLFNLRFIDIDLGQITIHKAFNNYLDYKSRYILKLPYGAGECELDPSMLFRNNYDTGTVYLDGIFDFDTGYLTLKVSVGDDVVKQLVFETNVNMVIDIPAFISDKMAKYVATGKAAIAVGASIFAMANKAFTKASEKAERAAREEQRLAEKEENREYKEQMYQQHRSERNMDRAEADTRRHELRLEHEDYKAKIAHEKALEGLNIRRAANADRFAKQDELNARAAAYDVEAYKQKVDYRRATKYTTPDGKTVHVNGSHFTYDDDIGDTLD